MLARSVRSGLTETRHGGAVVAVDADGRVLGRWGRLDRRFFLRSAAKPFQATVSLEHGATLTDEELAVACASHSAEPVHLALTRRILGGAGLDEDRLRCPPDLPMGAARDALFAAGPAAPAAIYHNCSGKHAAMLAACVASGWPLETYYQPGHPLQVHNRAELADALGEAPAPVGVDGCGVPTFGVTVESMARSFARFAADERYRRVREAMHRYPALTSGTGRPEAKLAAGLGLVAKGGAAGCIGVAVPGRLGLAAKADDGSFEAAVVAAAEALRLLGLVPDTAAPRLEGVATMPVLGRGEPVGRLEPAFDEA